MYFAPLRRGFVLENDYKRLSGNSGGSGETIVINATGGDWIHKRDLVKLLREMKRDFRFA